MAISPILYEYQTSDVSFSRFEANLLQYIWHEILSLGENLHETQ